MTPKDRTPEGWTHVAETYDRAVSRFTGLYAADALRWAGIRAGQRVLDLAAGPGALALAAARLGAGVTAVDVSPGMVARLRHHAAREKLEIRAEVMDGQALELPDASFDAVFCIFGLMFFPDASRGLSEMRRVAARDAPLLATTWGPAEGVPFVNLVSTAVRELFPEAAPTSPPPILSLADAPALAALAEAAGWRSVRVEPKVHAWRHASPQAFWEGLKAGAPSVQAVLERLGPERSAKLGDAVVRKAAAYVQGGEVVLPSQANVLTGRA